MAWHPFFTAEQHAEADAEEEQDVLELVEATGVIVRQSLADHYDCDPEYFDAAIDRLLVAGRLERAPDGTMRLPV